MKMGQFKYAVDFYKEALETELFLSRRKESACITPLATLAFSYLRLGLFDQAKKLTRDILIIEPENEMGLKLCAISMALLKEFEQSIEIFKKMNITAEI